MNGVFKKDLIHKLEMLKLNTFNPKGEIDNIIHYINCEGGE